MTGFRLSTEGKARFRRMRLSPDEPASRIEGFEILDYLFEHGSETIEGITDHTGLSWHEAWNKLLGLLVHGYIEGTSRTPGFFG